MAKDLKLKKHGSVPSDVAAILDKPLSKKMLDRDLCRLAYTASDGTPRAIPIAFTWNGSEIVMCTPTNAPKLASSRAASDAIRGNCEPGPAPNACGRAMTGTVSRYVIFQTFSRELASPAKDRTG